MTKRISNQDAARILREIGEYLEMQSVPFKPRAYEKAAEAVDAYDEQIYDLYHARGVKGLGEIPGVGVSIAEKLEELIRTGHIASYEALKKQTPVKLDELSRVEGVGPKSAKKLYDALGIKTLADLERAAKGGKLATVPGFGKKSAEKILHSIEFLKQSGGRMLLGEALPRARQIEATLLGVKGVAGCVVAGSVRRRKETIGDIDFLAVARDPAPVMKAFTSMSDVSEVLVQGNIKSSVRLRSGFELDLRVVSPESFGAALQYFTGSKEHNVALRELAVKKGWKLNEYGLWKGEDMIAGKTEEEIYRVLGLDYIEPEMREHLGELEIARAHKIPKLIGYGDLLGDLQVQTDWTDGSASIEEMAKAALARGLRYIAITDHTKRLAMTHGLDEMRIKKQWEEIDRVNKKLAGKIKILKGTECDILKDGSLDLSDEILSQLDVVGVSVHSFFNLPRKEQTTRVIHAIENPHADILFHPTGRLINRRPAYDIDMDEVIKTAKRTGTVLEIDAFPDRLDLKDDHIRKAVEVGVRFSIDSDAHAPEHFGVLEYGIAQARRGWCEKKDVINTESVEKMLQYLK